MESFLVALIMVGVLFLASVAVYEILCRLFTLREKDE